MLFRSIVFATRIPDSASVLKSAPVLEFDRTGRIIRRWRVPRDVEYWDVVEGVEGDEVITAYAAVRADVHLRVATNGTFRITAAPPPALEAEVWIDAGDSTFVRVVPADAQDSQHPVGVRGVEPGHWVPDSVPGWYKRTDTIAGLPMRARGFRLNQPPRKRGIVCPSSPEFEGMRCVLFPGGGAPRRIAFPIPIT